MELPKMIQFMANKADYQKTGEDTLEEILESTKITGDEFIPMAYANFAMCKVESNGAFILSLLAAAAIRRILQLEKAKVDEKQIKVFVPEG